MLIKKRNIVWFAMMLVSVFALQATADENRVKHMSSHSYLKSSDVSRMKDGYPMQVDGVGDVIVKSIHGLDPKHPRANRPLLIDKRGLQKKITKYFKSMSEQERAGKRRTGVALKSSDRNTGDVWVCMPVGNSAPVCFTISCEYDPDSAVLPCL